MNTLTTDSNNKSVARWLILGIAMTIIQVVLGGITRLTGSGLSITEWDIITGTLPPLNEQAWMHEFSKYRQTPQFQLLNFEFTLADFKFIFFWEWFHRLWARLIGVVFATGFIWFFVRRQFKKEMIQPLLILFVLGALQGAVGWIMVTSGLTGDAVYVKPTRLALHFVFALGLLCYTCWFALKLLIPKYEITMNKPINGLVLLILTLLTVQLGYGALMAGHKAANVAATWPSINGEWMPDQLFSNQSFLLNLIDNKIWIHFIHRNLAYLLLLLTILLSCKLTKVQQPSLLYKMRWIPLLIILAQVLLGIASLLSSKYIIPGKWGGFEWLAQLHQLTGMCLLIAYVWILYLTSHKTK